MRYAKDDQPLPFPRPAPSEPCDASLWSASDRAVVHCAGGCDGNTHNFQKTA